METCKLGGMAHRLFGALDSTRIDNVSKMLGAILTFILFWFQIRNIKIGSKFDGHKNQKAQKTAILGLNLREAKISTNSAIYQPNLWYKQDLAKSFTVKNVLPWGILR